jgi:hypothetical protein
MPIAAPGSDSITRRSNENIRLANMPLPGSTSDETRVPGESKLLLCELKIYLGIPIFGIRGFIIHCLDSSES